MAKKIVTCISDKNNGATACKEMLKAHPEQILPEANNNSESTESMWCGTGKIGYETVMKLLVLNELLYSTKKRTINKIAEKELEKVNSLLKKLWNHP